MKRHRLKIQKEFGEVFFTADLHLHHAGLLEKGNCPRMEHLAPLCRGTGLPPVELMGDEIMRQWREAVPFGATVFLLGDASFHSNKAAMAQLSSLPGKERYMLHGNHDKKLPPGWTAGWDGFLDLTVTSPSSGKQVHATLSHYPLEAWKESHYGTWCLHGHCHGHSRQVPNRFDVGVDTALVMGLARPAPFAPYSLAELLGLLGEPRYWEPGTLEPEGHHLGCR